MIDTWHGIEASEAEAQLDTLYRRLSDLDDAIQAQSVALANDSTSFAFAMMQKSLLGEQQMLQERLHSLLMRRTNESVSFRLNGPRFSDHSADFNTLSFFLSGFQRVFTSFSHALLKGPTRRGRIPTSIEDLTRLRVFATAAGSFELQAAISSRTDLAGDNQVIFTLERLFEFLQSKPNDPEFLDWAAQVGSRSISHYRRFINFLEHTETVPMLEWRNPTGIQKVWKPSYDEVRRIRERISSITEEKTELREYAGVLVGASLIRRTFEIITRDDGVFRGKIAMDAVPKVPVFFGKMCHASIAVITYLDTATADTKSTMILVDLEENPSPS